VRYGAATITILKNNEQSSVNNCAQPTGLTTLDSSKSTLDSSKSTLDSSKSHHFRGSAAAHTAGRESTTASFNPSLPRSISSNTGLTDVVHRDPTTIQKTNRSVSRGSIANAISLFENPNISATNTKDLPNAVAATPPSLYRATQSPNAQLPAALSTSTSGSSSSAASAESSGARSTPKTPNATLSRPVQSHPTVGGFVFNNSTGATPSSSTFNSVPPAKYGQSASKTFQSQASATSTTAQSPGNFVNRSVGANVLRNNGIKSNDRGSPSARGMVVVGSSNDSHELHYEENGESKVMEIARL